MASPTSLPNRPLVAGGRSATWAVIRPSRDGPWRCLGSGRLFCDDQAIPRFVLSSQNGPWALGGRGRLVLSSAVEAGERLATRIEFARLGRFGASVSPGRSRSRNRIQAAKGRRPGCGLGDCWVRSVVAVRWPVPFNGQRAPTGGNTCAPCGLRLFGGLRTASGSIEPSGPIRRRPLSPHFSPPNRSTNPQDQLPRAVGLLRRCHDPLRVPWSGAHQRPLEKPSTTSRA
jgi:hypothetical protein